MKKILIPILLLGSCSQIEEIEPDDYTCVKELNYKVTASNPVSIYYITGDGSFRSALSHKDWIHTEIVESSILHPSIEVTNKTMDDITVSLSIKHDEKVIRDTSFVLPGLYNIRVSSFLNNLNCAP